MQASDDRSMMINMTPQQQSGIEFGRLTLTFGMSIYRLLPQQVDYEEDLFNYEIRNSENYNLALWTTQ